MADKGGNVVVMDTTKYQEMCLDMLSNVDWYALISEEKIHKFNCEYDMIVHNAFINGVIDKEIFEALKTPFPRIPSFYSLPKTHKSIVKPPARPIISGVGTKTEKGSRLVDIFL